MGVREREGSKVSLKFQGSAKIITTFVDYLLCVRHIISASLGNSERWESLPLYRWEKKA